MFSKCLILRVCVLLLAQQGACVNRARERDSEGSGATETKIGVDMKGTRCDSTQIALINQLLERCMLGTWRCTCLCHILASQRFNMCMKAQSLLLFLVFFLYSFSQSVSSSFLFFLLPSRSSLIHSLQIHPPVFSLVIKSCQAEVGLHSIIPRSSHIWCSPEESRHNTHHLLNTKYVGEFCRIFTQSHSVPFINYHITKEAHLLCMVCCLGARSNSPL